MSENTTLTVSDALALQNTANKNGWFGGAGGGAEMNLFFLFFLMMAMGGGGGFGFAGRTDGIPNQINNDFLYNGMQRSMSDLSNNVSRGFDNTNNILGQGFAQLTNQNFGISKEVAQYNYNNAIGQASLSREIGDCCCSTNRNIDATRYEMAKGFCDTITNQNLNTRDILENQTANTQKILDLFRTATEQQLRDELSLARMQNIQSQNQLSQLAQTDAIVSRINPTPIPAYITCPSGSWKNGYGVYNGCGYGFSPYGLIGNCNS